MGKAMDNRDHRVVSSFEEVLEQNGVLAYTNVGTSMMPLLRQGLDVIELRKKEPGERCKKYDVVLFRRGERYILHRILRVRKNDYLIVGDHCFEKEFVPDERVIGVLVGIVRDGKQVGVGDLRYRAYVHLWCDFYPIRAAILRLKAFLKRKKR